MRNRRIFSVEAIFLAASLIDVTPAYAHDMFGLSAAPFWLGALHLIVAPLGVVSVIAFAAAIPFSSGSTIVWSSIAAGLTAFATALWAPAPVAAAGPIGIIVAGLTAALGLEPTKVFGILLGLLAGFAAGAAAKLDVVAISACLGVSVAMISLSLWGVEAFIHTRRFVPLARRVVGAWMAAIALLLGALALKTLFATHR
jgi:hypothetical protein